MLTSVFVGLIAALALFGKRLVYCRGDLHKIPAPWCFPFVGSAIRYLTTADKVIPVIDELIHNFGRISLLWMGYVPVLNVASPEGAEAVLTSKTNIKKGRSYNLLRPWLGLGLLTSDGNRWFSHRRLITPTFHFSILESFLDIFQENSRILTAQLRATADSGNPIQIHPFITRCALDIICEAAMGTKINAQKQSSLNINERDELTSQYVKSIFRISQLTTERILNILIRPSFIFFRTPQGRAYNKYLKVVHAFTEDVIHSRKAVAQSSPIQRGERKAFLDLLLEARDKDGKPLSDKDIREEVDTFMFEGHDTTASAMIWTLYLLGKHLDVQDEVYKELQEIFGTEGTRTVTLADLSEMKALERVLKEALRLYPSVPTVTRTVEEDINIGGYLIPEGTSVLLHIYQLHRDPTIFSDPDRFDPNRFLPENATGRHPFSYVPFSAGPRNCIGQKFALLEEKVILSTILLEYKVVTFGALDEQQIRSELILRPPHNLQFCFEKR